MWHAGRNMPMPDLVYLAPNGLATHTRNWC